MSHRAREVEAILLTMAAALPLYVTQALSPLSVALFHMAMAAVAARVARGRGPELVPPTIQSIAAVLYFVFFMFDSLVLSRSLIASSTHLLLFIAVYQTMEAVRVRNQGQRLLITFLIFVASIATATHISILLFVVAFGFLMFRQLMYQSHLATIESVGHPYAEPSPNRAAAFYMSGTMAIALLLFPLLPRIRNPLVQGISGAMNNASTGLSESIDFNQQRTIARDPAVIARIWMRQDALAFFTPIRLRARVYETYERNEWKQPRRRDYVPVIPRRGEFRIADSEGFTSRASIQQRLLIGNSRLFLPVGTYKVMGVPQLVEGPTRDTYTTWMPTRELVNYEVGLARDVIPLQPLHPQLPQYPVTPAVAALAHQIVGASTSPISQGAKIAAYMSEKFRYVADPATIGRTMTVDDFLLRYRRGHCEYFAAGMVALMTALGVPTRIVGGFYGGQLNPLTGYFVIRKQDAHAWVEVFDGRKWLTFDPTPAVLRPGNASAGLVGLYATALSDSINYFWDRYILTFGLADQVALAADVLARGRTTFETVQRVTAIALRGLASAGPLIFMALVLLCGAFATAILRRRRPIFEELSAHLERLGIDLGRATTLEEALDRLLNEQPEAARTLQPLIALYEEEQFSGRASADRRAAIRRRLAELRKGTA